MGLVADFARALVPERKEAVAAAIPTWQVGQPQYGSSWQSFAKMASQGYMIDEVVFACIEERATSAAEPRIAAFKGKERLDPEEDTHPALDLLEHPNPFLDQFSFWAGLVMYLDIAGNAYVEKVYSRAGKLVELWLLRPDRVQVIPDRTRFIGGYRYTVGDFSHMFQPEEIIHFKTRHPLDDYYGLSPLGVLAQRVDLDVWQREFVAAFFRNAGVPAGMLNIKRTVADQERELIRNRFRQQYSGPQGWHNILVIDGGEADYQTMGLPLGQSGLGIGDLDQGTETRICMVYGVPPSIVGARVGMHSSSYANRVSDRAEFWENTLSPMYRHLSGTLSRGLLVDFPDLTRFEFDLSVVRALQDDEDKKVERHTKVWLAGGCTWKEYRLAIGLPPEPDEPGMLVLPSNLIPSPSDELREVQKPEPAPAPAPALPQPGAPPDPNADPNALPPPNGQA